MAIFPGSAIPSGISAYEIENSCRFNSPDVAYLVWTPSATATSTKIFTASCWVKRGIFGERRIFTAAEAGTGARPRTEFSFGDDGINIGINVTGSTWYYAATTPQYRDTSAWYHIVWSMDTSQATPADRSTLYINGVEVTDWASNTLTGGTSIPQDDTVLYGQSGIRQAVGAYASGNEPLTGSPYDGYIAEFYFVDGVEYAPSVFAETSSTTNQWIPLDSDDVKDAVTFGTNGFYQKYGANELANSFTDSSGGFVPSEALTCDVLVVAGGGGGGTGYDTTGLRNYGSGGGGAGGVRQISDQAVTAQTYSIVVGTGGAHATSFAAGDSGLTSSALGISASGGGGGGSTGSSHNGSPGGSGGGNAGGSGSAAQAGNTGDYSPVEGYAGGVNAGGAYGASGGRWRK